MRSSTLALKKYGKEDSIIICAIFTFYNGEEQDREGSSFTIR